MKRTGSSQNSKVGIVNDKDTQPTQLPISLPPKLIRFMSLVMLLLFLIRNCNSGHTTQTVSLLSPSCSWHFRSKIFKEAWFLGLSQRVLPTRLFFCPLLPYFGPHFESYADVSLSQFLAIPDSGAVWHGDQRGGLVLRSQGFCIPSSSSVQTCLAALAKTCHKQVFVS